jgi:hypothetical protein
MSQGPVTAGAVPPAPVVPPRPPRPAVPAVPPVGCAPPVETVPAVPPAGGAPPVEAGPPPPPAPPALVLPPLATAPPVASEPPEPAGTEPPLPPEPPVLGLPPVELLLPPVLVAPPVAFEPPGSVWPPDPCPMVAGEVEHASRKAPTIPASNGAQARRGVCLGHGAVGQVDIARRAFMQYGKGIPRRTRSWRLLRLCAGARHRGAAAFQVRRSLADSRQAGRSPPGRRRIPGTARIRARLLLWY